MTSLHTLSLDSYTSSRRHLETSPSKRWSQGHRADMWDRNRSLNILNIGWSSFIWNHSLKPVGCRHSSVVTIRQLQHHFIILWCISLYNSIFNSKGIHVEKTHMKVSGCLKTQNWIIKICSYVTVHITNLRLKGKCRHSKAGQEPWFKFGKQTFEHIFMIVIPMQLPNINMRIFSK